MDNRNIFKKLTSQCPVDYRINEIIRFKYPYIITKLKAQVNKSPDSSILQIYSVILRAMDLGMRTEKELFKFLGLKNGTSAPYFKATVLILLLSVETITLSTSLDFIADLIE